MIFARSGVDDTVKETQLLARSWSPFLQMTAGVFLILLGKQFQVGTSDHWVLLPRGIQLADPTAFQNDWFVQYAIQPHWMFDWITYAGEKLGVLAGVHFLYYLCTCYVFMWAAVRFCSKYLAPIPAAPLYLVALILVEPEALLGSTTPILGWALPHCLGGALLFLGATFLLDDRPAAFLITLFAALAAHLQHGAHLFLLGVAYLLLARPGPGMEKYGNRVALVSGVVAGLIVWIAQSRGLSHGDDFVEICRYYIPFHCHVPSWPLAKTIKNVALIGMGCLALSAHCGFQRNLLVVVWLPFTILVTGIVSDYFSLPLLSYAAKRFNTFRWVTLLYPFFSAGFIVLIFHVVTVAQRALRGTSLSLDSALTVISNLSTNCAVGFVVGILLILGHSNIPDRLARTVELASFGTREYQDMFPVGSTILAPTSYSVVPFVFRRAAVANWKSKPYGGPVFREWQARLLDIEEFYQGTGRRDLFQRYSITHVVVPLQGWQSPLLPEGCHRWRRFAYGMPRYEVPPFDVYDCRTISAGDIWLAVRTLESQVFTVK